MKKYATLLLIASCFLFFPLGICSQNSINLNGTTDYIAVRHDESLSIVGDFTIEAWIKPNDITGEKTILIKGNNGQCGNYGLFIKDGNLAFVSGGECSWTASRGPNSNLEVGVWQHVAAVGNSNSVNLYINGDLKDSISRTAVLGSINADDLWIGRSVFSTTNFFFNGLIDDVRIWEVAKSGSEIQTDMDTELSGLESDLMLYFKMVEGNEQCDVSDCSINNNHGSKINIDNSANLPEYVNDQPSSLVEVACGAALDFSNCLSFKDEFQLFVDSVLTNLNEGNANIFLNDELAVTEDIQRLQFYYANRTQLVDEYYDFLVELCNTYPQYFKINRIIDDIQYKYLGSFREQVHMYLRDYLRDYPEKESQFLSALDLTNANVAAYLEIWNDHQILLVDNYSLDDTQLTVIKNLLATIPDSTTNLGVILFREFYTNDYKDAIYTTQSISAINSFGWPIGSVPGNGFPEDFEPFFSDGFPIALSHEISHTIDFDYVRLHTRLNTWKNDLLAAAGTTYNEYLRTKVLDIGGNDFFQVSPQEFFASLANIYFSNSALTLDLAIERFNDGYKQPINQFLLMADALSEESDSTIFYVIDELSNIEFGFHAIERNSDGFISAIYLNDQCKIEFLYDENDFVTELINPECVETFPYNAFTVYTETPACPDVNNGIIEIEASSDTLGNTFDVHLTGNGRDELFSDQLSYNAPLTISDLAPGTYSITISLETGFSTEFEQVVIGEPEHLSAKRQKINGKEKRAFYTVSGSKSYTVFVNSKRYSIDVSSKTSQTIAVPITLGENKILIKGAECQTDYQDLVFISDIKMYPNPVDTGFFLSGANFRKITIFNSAGLLVKTLDLEASEEHYIDIQELPAGVYFVQLFNTNTEIIKVVKK